ncbi:hypothetical protein [Litorisediminicola beolgyonensis]|uniref:Uncharacterized protein n=1 Tax=Litorisediminicola beolgyonensis TaxID=1173614 RepID=A0ABW3ZKR4_9RHOB
MSDAIPVLKDIVRQHAEQAAFLWTIYDDALLNPDEERNENMDDTRIARVRDQLEAHIDGLRIAGKTGRTIAQERYNEFPEAGELFVLRMLHPGAERLTIATLDLDGVRRYLDHHLA